MTSTKLRMAKGAAWMVFLKFAIRSLGLVSTVILARLLLPSDFGLIALGTAVIAVVEIFSSFNFAVALIQNQEATHNHYDTAWTLNLLLALVTAMVLVLLAAPTASFYDEPRLTVVMSILAGGVVITGFENIGVVDFRKNLEFHREFRFRLSQKIAGFVIVVPLAFILRNYWALLAGILAGKFAGTAASYFMHPYRPRISLSASRELFHFSKWLLLNNIIYVLRHRSADFIIAKTAGPRPLGIFTLSYEISSLATTELAAPIDRAVLPGYAQMSTNPHALRDGYFSVIGMIALIGVPTAIGIAATAKLFVPVLLGANWLETIEVIQILATAGAVSILATSIGSICITTGKPNYLLPLGGVYVIVLLPLLLILTPRFQGLGAAWAYFGAAAVSLPVQFLIVLRLLGARVRELVAALWRPVIASAMMYLALNIVMSGIQPPNELMGQILQLAAVVGFGVIVYVAAVFILWLQAGRPIGAETAAVARIRDFGSVDATANL